MQPWLARNGSQPGARSLLVAGLLGPGAALARSRNPHFPARHCAIVHGLSADDGYRGRDLPKQSLTASLLRSSVASRFFKWSNFVREQNIREDFLHDLTRRTVAK